jgi:cyclopropane-fatty-acyl-phospholipid synthase
MSERAGKIQDAWSRKTLQFLQLLLRDFRPRNIAIELWDGMHWSPEDTQFQRCTWKINNPGVLRAIISSSNREVALAEQYISGNFDVAGDMEAVFPLAEYLLHRKWSATEKLRLSKALLTLPPSGMAQRAVGVRLRGRLHDPARDQQAVTYHYDVSNDFYALWLDKNMLYSAAYFEREDQDIDTAQANKLDYICRKLRLKPGERLLDIGCGWGALIIHAARVYGVTALGITLSPAQLELAKAQIRDAGLSDRCEVRLLDYRHLDEREAYDKLVSIGMVEHVGESNLPDYFAKALSLLRPGGLFLNSGIARAGNRPPSHQPTFTDLYVFPDGELPPIGTLVGKAEEAGFEVRDVENLREHYQLTTRQWLYRLEAHAREAQQIVGDRTYRIWRLYLAGSAYYFQRALLGLFQTLLVKNDRGYSGMPLTRNFAKE